MALMSLLLAAWLTMAPSAEEFVLRTGAPHRTATGWVFTLEEGGHKHGEGGVTSGRYTLRFSRGKDRGSLPFTVSEPEDWWGEGEAFGSLFRLAGPAPGGGVHLSLRAGAKALRQAPSCGDVLSQRDFASQLPAGISFAGGAALRDGTGACVFTTIDGSAVVVVGKYSLEVLHVSRHQPPGPPPK